MAVLTSDNEGVPTALVEAALAGIPAVATNAGSVSDAVLDGITGRVREIVVQGDLDRPSTYLLAGWLRSSLGVPVATADSDAGHVESITVTLDDGEIVIDRPAGATAATISRTGARDQLTNRPLRPMEDCLMEDLRRLDSDPIYARALAAAQP